MRATQVEALCNLQPEANGAAAPDTKALCQTVAKALRRAQRCQKQPLQRRVYGVYLHSVSKRYISIYTYVIYNSMFTSYMDYTYVI